jgi:hypothetical protein
MNNPLLILLLYLENKDRLALSTQIKQKYKK